MMTFSWEQKDGAWRLAPSSISVRQDGGFWYIHLGDCPLNARYTSEQGAKLDAWQFAVSKRKALFGAYRIELVA